MSVGARGQKQPALLVSVSVILFVASFVGWARQGDPPISANKHRTGGTLSAAAGAAPQDTEARDLKPIPLQQSAHHLIRGAAHPGQASSAVGAPGGTAHSSGDAASRVMLLPRGDTPASEAAALPSERSSVPQSSQVKAMAPAGDSQSE